METRCNTSQDVIFCYEKNKIYLEVSETSHPIMKNIQTKKILYLFVLFVIPVLYVATGFFFQSERGFYFLFSVDPEYCYLFNSLNISQFTLKVWHVDHPGTPTQLLGALVIRVIHLFCGKEPLLQDVMHNSALYARAITVTIFSLNGIALFLLGKVAFKLFKNIFTALFSQLTPFASYLVLTLILRINPEHVAVLSVILLTILILKYVHCQKVSGKWIDWYMIGFAFIAGFTIAVKMTFLPLVFVPFFLFKGFIRKILYAVFSGIFFILFILPVLYYRHEYFFEWIKSLFIHSGKYGTGEANIVDKDAFLNSLHATFSFEFLFTFAFFLFVLVCLVHLLPAIRKRFRDKIHYKLLLGTTLSMLLQILLVAKQFTYHYLTPALLLIILGIYAVMTIFLKNVNTITKNLIVIVLAVYIFYTDYSQVWQYHVANTSRKEALHETYDFIQQNKTDKALVIVPSYYGCPYQEYSMYFGLFWGGDIMKPRYIEALNEIYPNTYFYNGWDEMLHYWSGDAISYIDVLKKHNTIRMYIGDSIIENDVMKYVVYNIRRVHDTRIKKIFSNESTHENIYEISYDSSAAKMDSTEIVCNADSLTQDGKYFTGTFGQSFKNGITQSSEKAFSGKFSCKLSGENKYGMTYIIGQIRKGEHYRVSVWRNDNNMNATLVVSARNGDDYYVSEKNAVQKNNGWSQLIIDFVVPENLNNKEIRIYSFNDTGISAYFDDLKITAY